VAQLYATRLLADGGEVVLCRLAVDRSWDRTNVNGPTQSRSMVVHAKFEGDVWLVRALLSGVCLDRTVCDLCWSVAWLPFPGMGVHNMLQRLAASRLYVG
ncbi:MAG: hypothetical protein ACKPKO_28550, partial [Candidatus Fonsibacter sp.]